MTIVTTPKYKEVNGTHYRVQTDAKIINWLETARERNQRIRVFYGDTVTGRDWMEENDTMGYVGRSTGFFNIPLLVFSKRSLGGTAILDHCIVRITIDGRDVYRHHNYHQPELFVAGGEFAGEDFRVQTEDDVLAFFGSEEKAHTWKEFMEGKRNRK